MPNQASRPKIRSQKVACISWIIMLLIGLSGAQADAQSVLGLQLSAGGHARSPHAPSTMHFSGVSPLFYTPYGWIDPVYPTSPLYSNCFLFANCIFFAPYQPLKERRQKLPPRPKFYGEQHQPDAAMEAWRASLRPAPAPFRTDERLIQPQFRDRSLIRPEFEPVGKPLPTLEPK